MKKKLKLKKIMKQHIKKKNRGIIEDKKKRKIMWYGRLSHFIFILFLSKS